MFDAGCRQAKVQCEIAVSGVMQPTDFKYAAIALETWRARTVSGNRGFGIAAEFVFPVSTKVAFALRRKSVRELGPQS